MRILLVYASKHGHTAKIAARIAETLEHEGVEVTQARLGDGAEPPAPHGFDAVVVGASIHAGHHQDAAVRWAERHHAALATVPSAFFSVCLTAADDTEESRTATLGYLDDFVERSGWTPDADDHVRRRAAVPRVRLRDPAADAPADAARRPSDRRVARLRLHGLGRGRALRTRVRGARAPAR